MNQSIYNYLKNYDNDVSSINRLLVSAFIHIKKIKVENNINIKNLIINENQQNEFKNFKEFIHIIEITGKRFCFEELVELFEFVISPSDKLVNGAVYTPDDIREFITNETFKRYVGNINTIKIADISCGCGGFLINTSLKIKSLTNKSFKNIFEENIFGIDIQEYSIERTEILLTLLAIKNGEDEKEFKFNLYSNDSLKYNWKEKNKTIGKNGGFDLIVGNPPYVCSRNMDYKTKEAMKAWTTCSTGHPDLYIPFFQIGYELLRKDGILGYITVNTFIKSLNGRAIRQYFSDQKVYLEIIDFEDEQIFNSRMTYTSICFLQNKTSEKLYYLPLKRKKLNNKLRYKEHKYNKLDNEKGWYLQNRKLILQMEAIGIKLGDIYTTRSGVATLKNSIYIFKPVNTKNGFYYIDNDTKVEEGICRDIVNSNMLVKTNKIDNLIEKLIFPYEYDEENKVRVMDIEKIEKDYPYAYDYLVKNKDILATRDKGKGKDYEYWYAFGRNQSLERTNHKLLFPQLAKKGFQSYICSNKNLYFYNGMAVMSDELEKLQILEKLFLTDIFWKYVSSISKHYASGYYSLGRNYIKNFGVFQFSTEDKKYLLNKNLNVDDLNIFINNKYCIK